MLKSFWKDICIHKGVFKILIEINISMKINIFFINILIKINIISLVIIHAFVVHKENKIKNKITENFQGNLFSVHELFQNDFIIELELLEMLIPFFHANIIRKWSTFI